MHRMPMRETTGSTSGTWVLRSACSVFRPLSVDDAYAITARRGTDAQAAPRALPSVREPAGCATRIVGWSKRPSPSQDKKTRLALRGDGDEIRLGSVHWPAVAQTHIASQRWSQHLTIDFSPPTLFGRGH